MKTSGAILILIGLAVAGYSVAILSEQLFCQPNYIAIISHNLESIEGHEKEKENILVNAKGLYHVWRKGDWQNQRLFFLAAGAGLFIAGLGVVRVSKKTPNKSLNADAEGGAG